MAYGTHDIQPRYHLSNCSTLRQMRERNRFERYVVASRTDGRFELNIIGHKIRREVHELSVCQNCLAFLDFNSFNMTMPATERRDRVRAFSLEDFFTKYPRSLHQVVPSHNSDNAPINTYSDGFEHISGRVRALGGWRCSECGIELSAPGHRKWLHVHHRNGLRHDNRRENLKVICFACHAEEADHSHMKNHPDYLTFVMVRMHIRGPR